MAAVVMLESTCEIAEEKAGKLEGEDVTVYDTENTVLCEHKY